MRERVTYQKAHVQIKRFINKSVCNKYYSWDVTKQQRDVSPYKTWKQVCELPLLQKQDDATLNTQKSISLLLLPIWRNPLSVDFGCHISALFINVNNNNNISLHVANYITTTNKYDVSSVLLYLRLLCDSFCCFVLVCGCSMLTLKKSVKETPNWTLMCIFKYDGIWGAF